MVQCKKFDMRPRWGAKPLKTRPYFQGCFSLWSWLGLSQQEVGKESRMHLKSVVGLAKDVHELSKAAASAELTQKMAELRMELAEALHELVDAREQIRELEAAAKASQAIQFDHKQGVYFELDEGGGATADALVPYV
jgi:hypothetical protein